MNSTIIYIVIITLFVLLMIYIAFRIVSKKIRSSTILPKDIDFEGKLNNFDSIIGSVSKKEEKVEKKDVENEKHLEEKHQQEEIKEVKQVQNTKKLKESKVITKKTFIAKEILDRKKD